MLPLRIWPSAANSIEQVDRQTMMLRTGYTLLISIIIATQVLFIEAGKQPARTEENDIPIISSSLLNRNSNNNDEATRTFKQQLWAQEPDRKQVLLSNAGIGDKPGEAELKITANSLSSDGKTPARLKRSLGDKQDTAKRKQARPSKRQQNVIQAMLKGSATIPCNLGVSELDEDNSVNLILFYKDKSMVPIYSVDARATSIQEARHKPGPWLEGRSSLKISKVSDIMGPATSSGGITNDSEQLVRSKRGGSGNELFDWHKWRRRRRFRRNRQSHNDFLGLPQSNNGSARLLVAELNIDFLSSEDNGLYSCKVDYKKARSKTQESILRIIVPADKPTIRDLTSEGSRGNQAESGPRLSQNGGLVLGPHNEGSKVVLLCETQGGYPEPRLTWWRNGELIDDSFEIVNSLDGTVIGQHIGSFKQVSGSGSGDQASEEFSSEDNDLADHDNNNLQQQQQDPQQDDIFGQENQAAARQQVMTQNQNNNRLIRNKLELNSLSRLDLMANYSCQAWNTKLSEAPTTSLMIDMNLRPIKVQIDNNDKQQQANNVVLADKRMELICRAFGSRPPALISWFKNGARFSDRNKSIVDIQDSTQMDASSNLTVSTLNFTPQIEDGGQIVTCRAENPLIGLQAGAGSEQPASLEDSIKLDVYYLPKVRLALGEKLSSERPIQEGHDVYFECSVSAHPDVQEIRWWFNGRELETNVSMGIIISNKSLVLQRVSKSQRGRYTCSAINQVGESQSNSVYLRIQYAPICRDFAASSQREQQQHSKDLSDRDSDNFAATARQKFKTHYGAAKMESVKVYCHVDADPYDSLNFKWAFVSNSAKHQPESDAAKLPEFSGQQMIFLNDQLASKSPENPLSSVLSYTPASDLDYGTLLCWAQNGLGKQSEPCAYQVVPADKPDPVKNCRLLNATDNQLIVTCEPGYDGGVEQTLQMEVYTTESGDHYGNELVANVSTTSYNVSQNLLSANELDFESWKRSNQTDYLNDADVFSSAASLVVSDQVNGSSMSKQQKQRHSSSGDNVGGQLGANPQPFGTKHSESTLFVTEPNLKPATNYLLSIYSINQKGSSKPVAFTATTTNSNTTFANIFNNQLGFPRDGRKLINSQATNQSQLFNDVLSLSWNPFLIVCVITIILFILFASLTFAMMKYIDLFSLPPPGGQSRNGKVFVKKLETSEAISNSDPFKLAKETNLDGLDQQVANETNASSTYSSSSTTSGSNTNSRKKHAKIISSKADEDRERGSLLLDGSSYLKLKLEQLATSGCKLKQSNSDNHLNQTVDNLSACLVGGAANGTASAGIQMSAFTGGTLPKNLSIFRNPRLANQNNYAAYLPSRPLRSDCMQVPRVEQLVISGKQYIHQTAPSTNSFARAQPQSLQQQQQQQQQNYQRHLQLTSGNYSAYGEICKLQNEQTNGLYSASSSLKDAYPHPAAHNQHHQHLACLQTNTIGLPPGSLAAASGLPLVCINNDGTILQQQPQTIRGLDGEHQLMMLNNLNLLGDAQLLGDNLNFAADNNQRLQLQQASDSYEELTKGQQNNRVHAQLTLIGYADPQTGELALNGTGSDTNSSSNWNGTCFDSDGLSSINNGQTKVTGLNGNSLAAGTATNTFTTGSSPSSSAQFNCELHHQQQRQTSISNQQPINGFKNHLTVSNGSTSTITSSQATDQALGCEQELNESHCVGNVISSDQGDSLVRKDNRIPASSGRQALKVNTQFPMTSLEITDQLVFSAEQIEEMQQPHLDRYTVYVKESKLPARGDLVIPNATTTNNKPIEAANKMRIRLTSYGNSFSMGPQATISDSATDIADKLHTDV